MRWNNVRGLGDWFNHSLLMAAIVAVRAFHEEEFTGCSDQDSVGLVGALCGERDVTGGE
jgi:hypothetical protein